MRTTLKALALTAVITAAGVTGIADGASAASGVRACPYRYVVSDGVANRVSTYRSPRGKARQGSIAPNETFVVFFGNGAGAPDQVAGRHLSDHGWVAFPRTYLQPSGRCTPVSTQALQDASQTFALLTGAQAQASRQSASRSTPRPRRARPPDAAVGKDGLGVPTWRSS